MDWQAFRLSQELALATCLVLIPAGVLVARQLAWRNFMGKSAVQALLALPLVLPPTVLGYYLLVSMGSRSAIGQTYEQLFGSTLVFTFEGLVVASILFNIPFAIQPIQRGFEAIPKTILEAAWSCGLSNWQTFWRIELPLAWPGVLGATIMTAAHTIGEFGVILMVGGSIPGETRVIAISIYDRVQAFDNHSAGVMSASLLLISFLSIMLIHILNDHIDRRHGKSVS